MFRISRLSSELVAGERLEALVAPYLKTAAVVTIGVIAGPEFAVTAGLTVVIFESAAEASAGATRRMKVPAETRSSSNSDVKSLRAVLSALLSHAGSEQVDAGSVVACADHQELSKRELEVLTELKNGGSNKQIARKLQIAEATVKIHVRRILAKTACENRTQAAIWARSNPRALTDGEIG